MNETHFDDRGVKGVKYCTAIWTINQRFFYVKSVERSSKYTANVVMLCMLKLSKKTQNTF